MLLTFDGVSFSQRFNVNSLCMDFCKSWAKTIIGSDNSNKRGQLHAPKILHETMENFFVRGIIVSY